jgi:cyclohexyl-isocyanide hydratase
MNRRTFQNAAIASIASMLAARAGATNPVQASRESAQRRHMQAMQRHASLGAAPTAKIGMLVYPGMYLMDLAGPLAVFEALMHREIHLLWKDKTPVANEKPEHQHFIPVPPTTTFDQCPKDLDVLFVPGGIPGTLTMMEDMQVLDFLAERGKTARYVTSVCTGSLILGAAGLLTGYRAATYWAMHDVLKEFGATPVRRRVVTDRNRITGGGVTAGIDFGLQIAAKLTSDMYAQALQLYLEYDPAPPFNAGSPDKAPAQARVFMQDMFAGLNQTATLIAQQTMQRRKAG